MVDDDSLPGKPDSCPVCVHFTACVTSVLGEEELDDLHLTEEEFVILRRSVEDKKNLLRMMVERSRIVFLYKC